MILAAPLSVSKTPAGVPDAGSMMSRARSENFPVASRMLPRAARSQLLAVYGFARLVDEIGDSASGDRLAALDWLEGELDGAYEGRATHPLMRRLAVTLSERELPREPFARLIEANRVDQRVERYETWDQLLAYCDLSANPVGELVLRVLEQDTAERIVLSDAICTGLQLTEHWQDLAEDRRAGRIYLPAEDLERFGCAPADLDAMHAGERLRELLAFEVARTHELFDLGAPLVAELHGRARFAVAAFLGGGRAALEEISRARWDVLPGPPRAGHVQRAIASWQAYFGAAR